MKVGNEKLTWLAGKMLCLSRSEEETRPAARKQIEAAISLHPSEPSKHKARLGLRGRATKEHFKMNGKPHPLISLKIID
jgi:hypothetical protein